MTARVALAGLLLAYAAAAFAASPVQQSVGKPRTGNAVASSEQPGASETSGGVYAPPSDVGPDLGVDVAGGRPVDVPMGAAAPTSSIDVMRGAMPADSTQPVTGSLVYQVQLLRQELQQLRGQLEQQQHQITRMEAEQKARYLDVDRRLSGATAAPAAGAPADPTSRELAEASPGVDAGERAAYATAFQLSRDKQYQAAIDAFNRQLREYPDGAFSANAFYWLGELYLALPTPKLEQARQSFAQVVNLYSDHPKMPDAMYKLGVVYGRLGDRDRAEKYMRRVRDEFPGTPAAGLAEAYLASAS